MNLFGVRNKSKPGFVSEGFTAGNYFLGVEWENLSKLVYFIFHFLSHYMKKKDLILHTYLNLKKNSRLLCSEGMRTGRETIYLNTLSKVHYVRYIQQSG